MEIIEMNKAICEFLGWEFREDPRYEYMAYFEGRQMWCDNLNGVNKTLLEGFTYHKNWEKLMPVYHAIREKAVELHYNTEAQKLFNKVKDQLLYGTIADVHLGAYNFVKWLKEGKQ